jgi:hypothetical protein
VRLVDVVYPAAESKNPEGGDPPIGPGTAARGTGCRIPNAGPGQLAPTICSSLGPLLHPQ